MDIIDISIYVTYLLIGVTALLAIVFPLYFMVTDFKKSRSTFLGVLVLGGLFLVSVVISTGEVYEKFGIDASGSKQIGGAIIMLYFMMLLAVGVALFSEINKLFK